MNHLTVGLAGAILCCGVAAAQELPRKPQQPLPGINLALGKVCTFSPAPNYGLATDPGDATDLTDAKYNGCDWRERGTVGWTVGRTRTFTVDLDLGSEQPVGTITFDTLTDAARLDVCRRTRLPSWVYACASEKNCDPFAYYRWFAWQAFKLGFRGIGMWVYADANCITPSDYSAGVSYALVYGWQERIVNSKRWEAWRQGIADFEYLTMLREETNAARAAGIKTEAVTQAERLLSEGVDQIVGDSPFGGNAAQPQAPDELRLQILECLQNLL